MSGMKLTAEQYVDDVLSGEQIAGRWVKYACERHRRDLEEAHLRGLYFDETMAGVAIAFFGMLRHWKGEWSGRRVQLEPWQQFVIWSLFGWRRADGTRRFRTGYLEVARKNGKTTMAAGVGLLLMVADGEPGAEIYSAATKRDQARISFRDATEMVRQSPQLRQRIGKVRDNLHSFETSSKFEPLGRDADSTDGLNVHGVIADELHAWKTRDLWDKLETATGSRRQPLMFAITTAGYDRQSLCFQFHDYAEKVAAGIVKDDSFFGLIYTLDGPKLDEDGNEIAPADNWEDESVWVKANPNLGVSKKWDDMRRKAGRAKQMPAALNAFLRLELNVWTQAESRWIDPARWAACSHVPPGLAVEPTTPFAEILAHMEAALRGRKCYGALDLSSNIDISAWVMVFPPESEDEPYWILPRFFIPEDNILERVRRDRVPYDAWLRAGLLTATPGNVIDYDWIVAQIDEDARRYDVAEIGFDRWGATKIQTQLMALGGDDWIIPIGQGFASMSPPMKELEKLILGRNLGHGGHPVLAWMADNLVATQDAAGNLKPDKGRSREKIDGMVALVMGIDRATRYGGVSKYETEELLVL